MGSLFLLAHHQKESSLETVNIAAELVRKILDLSHSSVLCNTGRSGANLTHFLTKSSRQALVETDSPVLKCTRWDKKDYIYS